MVGADRAVNPAPMSSGLGREKLETASGKMERDGGRVDMAVGVRLKVVG